MPDPVRFVDGSLLSARVVSCALALSLLAALLFMPAAAVAAPSTYCPTLNATVANGASVAIDVSTCDGPFDGGMSGPIEPIAQHGTVLIGENSGGIQFVTYAHSGNSATSDQFFLEDNDLGVVTVNITIEPPVSPISVLPGSLPAMTAGEAFLEPLIADGGLEPYAYSLQSGLPPPGLSLAANGTLSGTPTRRGGYSFTVRVTDANGEFADKGYSGTVQNPTLDIAPASTIVVSGVPFSQAIVVSGGVAPHLFTIESGSLPAGMDLSSDGVLSGTTGAAPGSYPMVLRVTDASTGPGVYFELENFTVNVTAVPPPSIAGIAPDEGPDTGGTPVTITGTSFTGAMAVTFGGTAAASYTVDSDTQISAVTPAGTAGAVNVVVTTPGGSATATGGFTYEAAVLPVLTINDVTVNEGDGNALFTISLSAPAGPGGVTFDVATADGTATTAGGDYHAFSGPNSIAGGTTVYYHAVGLIDDALEEPDETFFLDISNVVGATVAKSRGVATIVDNDGVPPTVTSVGVPANGYYRAGDLLSFTVNFSENVFVGTSGGAPHLPLTIGATARAASYVAGSGTSALVFVSTVLPGDQDLDGIAVGASIAMGGGTITGAGGTAAVPALNNVGNTSGVLVSTAEPTVLSTRVIGNPPSNAASVTFEIVFSEAVTGLTMGDLEMTTVTGSATAGLAGLATSDNITYTVEAHITGVEGTLRLDVPANAAVNIGGNGNPAYAGGVPWVVGPSPNAELSQLLSSAGALDPAFDPATTSYDVTVDHATDTITLTPTAAEPHATITVDGQAVASGSASQATALSTGTNAIPVVVTAQNGTTNRTYTVTVTRGASSNARLAGLAPSVGTLEPAFDADALEYAVAVANAVDSITLTPTADDAAAAIAVNGQPVASGGASQAIAVSPGSTAIHVLVTAQDGTTTRTYTVTVERAQPVPTVVSRSIEIEAGETASVDLAEGATGDPFTDAAIVDVSDADAGTARIEQDGSGYRLVFVSSPTHAGGANVRFTLSNAVGPSAPGTIAFTVLARPDPSRDRDVIGLLTAQLDAAKRFARVQTRNFGNRLEQLHDEGERRRSSMTLRLGYDEGSESAARNIRERMERSGDGPVLLGYAPQDGGSGTGFPADGGTVSAGGSGMDLGRYAVWTGGYVDFSESDSGGLDLDHTHVGVSAGVDYRFSRSFVGGFGIGFSRDRTDVGDNGTRSTGRAYSAALYGSYKPLDNLFLDGVVGGSWLDFDSRRYVTATGDFATGGRSGRQFFGALTAAYEFRDEGWLISPYGRVELSRTWLDGFAEQGGGGFGLRYGEQGIDTLSGVIGLRAEYALRTRWGKFTPGARIEYTHDFAGSSRIDLGYVDLDHLPYGLDVEATNRNHATLGLSLGAELVQDWNLKFDYRTAFGGDRQDHAFGLEVAKRF